MHHSAAYRPVYSPMDTEIMAAIVHLTQKVHSMSESLASEIALVKADVAALQAAVSAEAERASAAAAQLQAALDQIKAGGDAPSDDDIAALKEVHTSLVASVDQLKAIGTPPAAT